ncbi:MAG TPA: acetate/propionate family kinase [Streptosporangiaceae bacterium]|nr:acetate/propionate family kinase [Streptosporangiaceae bacterium]
MTREAGRPTGPPPAAGSQAVLVVNAGSSSLKLSVIGPDEAVTDRCDIEHWDGTGDEPALRAFLSRLSGGGGPAAPADEAAAAPTGAGGADAGGADAGGAGAGAGGAGAGGASAGVPVGAIGHRVVHGGSAFTAATLIDDAVLAQIAELTSLAPLHQPRALAGIAAASAAFPGVPSVACFDTAFHATLPPEAATYPLPAAWRDRFGLRKFGFHGLSHGYASRRAAEMLDNQEATRLRVVTCHLGAGSSLAAVQDGRSVETTMGFTPLDGLVMATRCGSIDPGLIMWLADQDRVPLAELADRLEHGSGLAGLADLPDGSGDLREVTAAAQRGAPSASLALAVHAHRLVAGIAAMAAAMNGMDALVFTGGVGEHQPAVRASAAAGLGFLGVAVDPERNAAARADADITAPGSRTAALVVTAREDIEIARQTRDLLARIGAG